MNMITEAHYVTFVSSCFSCILVTGARQRQCRCFSWYRSCKCKLEWFNICFLSDALFTTHSFSARQGVRPPSGEKLFSREGGRGVLCYVLHGILWRAGTTWHEVQVEFWEKYSWIQERVTTEVSKSKWLMTVFKLCVLEKKLWKYKFCRSKIKIKRNYG